MLFCDPDKVVSQFLPPDHGLTDDRIAEICRDQSSALMARLVRIYSGFPDWPDTPPEIAELAEALSGIRCRFEISSLARWQADSALQELRRDTAGRVREFQVGEAMVVPLAASQQFTQWAAERDGITDSHVVLDPGVSVPVQVVQESVEIAGARRGEDFSVTYYPSWRLWILAKLTDDLAVPFTVTYEYTFERTEEIGPDAGGEAARSGFGSVTLRRA